MACLLSAPGIARGGTDGDGGQTVSRDPERGLVALSPGTRDEDGEDSWGRAPGPASWLDRFWREHRYLILTVVLLEHAERYCENHVGTPDEPLLLGSPAGLDRAVAGRYRDASGSASFVAANKSSIAQIRSLSAIARANASDWEGIAHDMMGLMEAHKINWSVSSLVRNVVGRRRPSLESAVQERGDLSRFGPFSHNSFPSDAASKAFTYMACTDSGLARRREERPALRSWSAVGLYGLAGYVAFTRLEHGKHYLSDVVIGAGAGCLTGKSVYRWNRRGQGDGGRLSSRVRPVLAPGGAGVMLTARH